MLRSYHFTADLSKMNLVKDHLVGVTDGIESSDECEKCDDTDGNLIVPIFFNLPFDFSQSDVHLCCRLVNLAVDLCLSFPCSLAQGAIW